MKLSEVAALIGAKINFSDIDAAGQIEIKKLAPIEVAGTSDLSFIANPDYFHYAGKTKAAALIVKEPQSAFAGPQLIHSNPYLAFAKSAHLFFKYQHPHLGISERALISDEAQVDPSASVGAFAVIEANAKIGRCVVIYPGAYVGAGTEIGENTVLFANSVIYYGCKIGKNCVIHSGAVIGSDGFGYAVGKDEVVKIPQVGTVIIEDDVEIGASSTVNRAALGTTKIGRGTKLDCRVQIAHNVELGENCMFSAFTGVAGSTKIGDRVITGGHAGISGHLKICSDVRIGGKCGVIKDIDQSGEYLGFPEGPAMQWRRQQVYFKRLPDYEKRIKDLERKISELESKKLKR